MPTSPPDRNAFIYNILSGAVHRPQLFTYILMNASFCVSSVLTVIGFVLGFVWVFFFELSVSRRTFEFPYSIRFKHCRHDSKIASHDDQQAFVFDDRRTSHWQIILKHTPNKNLRTTFGSKSLGCHLLSMYPIIPRYRLG